MNIHVETIYLKQTNTSQTSRDLMNILIMIDISSYSYSTSQRNEKDTYTTLDSQYH